LANAARIARVTLSLARSACEAVAAAQPDRPRELGHQKGPLRGRRRSAARVAAALRILQLGRQFVQPAL